MYMFGTRKVNKTVFSIQISWAYFSKIKLNPTWVCVRIHVCPCAYICSSHTCTLICHKLLSVPYTGTHVTLATRSSLWNLSQRLHFATKRTLLGQRTPSEGLLKPDLATILVWNTGELQRMQQLLWISGHGIFSAEQNLWLKWKRNWLEFILLKT